MKNFKTAILLSVLVLLAITANAQNGNYFVKHDGTVVKMYGEKASFTGYIYYTDENGKDSEIYQDKVKLLIFGKAVFISRKEGSPLLRVIAFNNNYFIGGTLQSGSMVYWLFDREFNTIGKRAVSLYGAKGKGTTKAHKKQYDEIFGTFFKDCNELNEACHKNMDEARSAFLDIDYFNCGSSTDLITNKPIDKNVKPQPVMEKKLEYFYVTTTGEKVVIEDETKGGDQDFKNDRIATLNPNFKYNIGLSYFNGMPVYKSKTVPSKSVKYIFLSDNIYAPVNKNSQRILSKIFAFNNNYILIDIQKMNQNKGTSYIGFQIYDRLKNEVVEETNENTLPFLKNYFGDCPDLIKLVDDNLKNKRSATFGIVYYNCNNSKEFIEGGVQFE